MKNIQSIDQFVRLLLGVLAMEWGYFWLGEPFKGYAFAAATVLLLTGAFRFCPLYRLFGKTSSSNATLAFGKAGIALSAVMLSVAVIGGSYASDFFSRKWFLEDFNSMNHFYKQTLFLTGKNERASANTNFDQWRAAFTSFSNKYKQYRPHALRADTQLDSDLQSVRAVQMQVEPLVRNGDLHQAHLDLEKVRPIFQEMFKRNGFSLLSVALVDFHDTMEVLLDAAAGGNLAEITATYPVASDKLKAVEAEANDTEIQAIRQNLDGLMDLASNRNTGSLKAAGDQLKSSFVKVYLKRG
jgi:hypothetical protein